MINVSWAALKSYKDSTSEPLMYVSDGTKYLIAAGPFYCDVEQSGSDGTDFNDNYKASANSPPITKKEPIALYMARFEQAFTAGNNADVRVAVPATARHIVGGIGWFEGQNPGDYFLVDLMDPTETTVVRSFSDVDLPVVNQGWFFDLGKMDVSPITEGYDLPATFMLRVRAYTGDSRADTFRCNIKWGKK